MSNSVSLLFRMDYDEAGNPFLYIGPGDSDQSKSPPLPQRELSLTILFTGFKAADKKRLEGLANTSKFTIRKSVSHELTFIVAGDNAGPTKLADARHEGATVLTEAQFIQLIETGELPLGQEIIE